MLNKMFANLYLAMRREEGQTFVEYSMIGVLVAALLVTILGLFKNNIVDALTTINSAF
jgi:Flp pilus assembly pilin Flp